MDDIARAAVLDAARHSMGMDISDVDLHNVHTFAERVIKLERVPLALPGVPALEAGARRAQPPVASSATRWRRGSSRTRAASTNLAKYPASPVQILGAEKALFRALKTRGNTPKYGLIFHSTFIGRAAAKNKGRISRYLANKCSIACRIDNFAEAAARLFGREAARARRSAALLRHGSSIVLEEARSSCDREVFEAAQGRRRRFVEEEAEGRGRGATRSGRRRPQCKGRPAGRTRRGSPRLGEEEEASSHASPSPLNHDRPAETALEPCCKASRPRDIQAKHHGFTHLRSPDRRTITGRRSASIGGACGAPVDGSAPCGKTALGIAASRAPPRRRNSV